MCHQGSETGQEEEDKEGDQDTAEPVWWTERGGAFGRGAGSAEQNAVIDIRIREQREHTRLFL